ncbi:hypothetical protein H9Y04_28130 [Streptomyces sp. TRM66268-LWL]|uniref:Uncharacterized protein n=1 Tax=Streptomyces polyasparticus TaxID=2767826 RepID=A0ABR7SNH3_9ACTN|nr:hypothetical protein [Streptomyces polyasparticus]MBC9716409.1 hypothetical protein [Streptomyces polyasparticus]
MEAVASVIAVVGTLLGVGVSQLFQQRALARTERFAQTERLRQERLQVYSAYAGALFNYLRAQMDRWLLDHEQREFDATKAGLKARSFDQRGQVNEALYRVRLVTDRPELAQFAQTALDKVARIPGAADREEYTAAYRAAEEAIDGFVALAKEHV